MHRLFWTLVALLLVFGGAGCSHENPGAMSKEKVEAFMKNKLKLMEISLVEKAEGGYVGTGKRADGSKYSLEVTLDEKDRRIDWTVTDEKGTVTGGFEKHYR